MQRVTVTLDDDLLESIDGIAREHGYASRSEALRDIVRDAVGRFRRSDGPTGESFATLSYVFDHHKRDLARRLLQSQHEHHDLAVASMHVHLDHDTCLETVVLRGAASAIQSLADDVVAQRGVRYGHLHLIPAPAPHGAEEDEAREAAE